MGTDNAIKLPSFSTILSGAGEKRKSPEGGFGGVEKASVPPKAQTEYGPRGDGMSACFICAINNEKCTEETTPRNKNRACSWRDSGKETLVSGIYLTEDMRKSMLSKTTTTRHGASGTQLSKERNEIAGFLAKQHRTK
jgi:hypothetical protein